MTLREPIRSSIHQHYAELFGEDEAAAIMNEFPLIDWPEVVTRDHLDLRLMTLKEEVFGDPRFTAIGEQFRHLDGRLTLVASELDQRMQSMESRIDRRFAQIDNRFNQIDDRFNQIDNRFAQMDNRFERADDRLAHLERTLSEKIDRNLMWCIGLMATALMSGAGFVLAVAALR
jgi:DNA anti-recombination protein RmuC